MAAPKIDTLTLLHQLKQQIDELAEQQMDALKMATYVGMTPEEAKEYDQRREKITALVEELSELKKAQ
jgi:hypothetical protein